tara:strand:+ start:880 stop:1077 length:198 start_codon:yes stop_codon:yes gene_type:complete
MVVFSMMIFHFRFHIDSGFVPLSIETFIAKKDNSMMNLEFKTPQFGFVKKALFIGLTTKKRLHVA